MPKIDTTHKLYDKFFPLWEKSRTVINGEEDVKEKGIKYLPSLSDQTSQEYYNYKERALFYEASTRTAEGLIGFLFQKQPILNPPSSFLEFFEEALFNDLKIIPFLKNITKELIITNRVGLLVDVGDEGNPYITSYKAEDIINWNVDFVNGRNILKLVVLKEVYEEEKNIFEVEDKIRYRVLRFDDNGNYTQEIYVKVKDQGFELLESISPTQSGKFLDKIPFLFLNSNGINFEVLRPLLLGVINVNLSHYRSSADLEHGRHFTGLPTPWVAGFKGDNNGQLKIGSQVAWVSSNPDAKAGFLEFKGDGLKSLENALSEKEALMAVLGARLLEVAKNFTESADNQRIRKSGENSILSNLADSISTGILETSKICLEWKGIQNTNDLKIEIQKDVIPRDIDSSVLISLFQMMQGGALSQESFFYNLQKMGIIPDGRNLEEENNLIDNKDPSSFLLNSGEVDNLGDD